MARRTAPAPQTRREALLRAAADLFAERGFHGVGVDDIGAAAGISGPGVYRHFASKDAMLAEMLVGISEELLREGSRRVADEPDPGRALDALVRWHVEFALSNPALITVHDRDLGNLPEADHRRVRRLQRLYVEEWVAVIRRVAPPTGEAEARATAHALFGLINSTPHSAAGLSRADMAELLHRMAIAAVSRR
ncbi:MAG TPA: TetR/AcrR family transcriptional regulator [Mycobacteriales bacterium]|nr:TetR/AcrR family transcriptional regulator [Mycobacteriales bacterium]